MAQSTFLARMIGAATLDVATYEEVEHDTDATLQAAGVETTHGSIRDLLQALNLDAKE